MKQIPMIDAAMVLEAGATKTATFSSAWFDLGEGFTPGGLGDLLAGVVTVTARDRTTGDETYTFKLQETADDGTGNPNAGTIVDIGVAVSVNTSGDGTGVYVAKGVVTQRFIRLTMTAAGTTPSITYNANVGK